MGENMGLYRGKVKDSDIWAEGFYAVFGTGHFIGAYDESETVVWVEVEPKTVGQYTGLTDKNGVKIFEGDICRNTRNGEIVSVKWHGTMAGFVWSKRKEGTCLYDFGELFRAHDKCEVIGNIHDNPELLEVVTEP